MKYWRITFLSVGILPWLFSLFLIAFYIHATIALGHFPQYDMPDPQTLAFYSYYALIINATIFPTLLIMLPSWVILILIFILSRLRKEKYDTLILLSSIGVVLSYILYHSRIFEWFAD